MRYYRAGLLSLSAGLALAVGTLQSSAASQERVESEAQQRFERAQQHSRIQSGEASIHRQTSSLRNQQNTSQTERALQQQQLRQSQRDLQAEKRRYQQRSTSVPNSARTTDNDRNSSVR